MSVDVSELEGKIRTIESSEKPYHSYLYRIIFDTAEEIGGTLGGLLKRYLYTFSDIPPFPPENIKDIEELSRNPAIKNISGAFYERVLDLFKQYNDTRDFFYAREYSTKSLKDRIAPAPFDFNRSIEPVAADDSWQHELFSRLDSTFIRRRMFVNPDGSSKSLEEDGLEGLKTTSSYANLNKVRELKAQGKRVWLLISHPAYSGAFVPRMELRKMGFNDLAENWNVITGPRVKASEVWRNGTLNIGNTWNTLPSTELKHPELENIFRPIVVKTAHLIKGRVNRVTSFAPGEEELYESVKGEVFVVFPEGRRSDILEDGTISLRCADPAFLRGFIQAGEYVVLVNQCGAEKIRPYRMGKYGVDIAFSVGEPIEITKDMLEKQNSAAQVKAFMQGICDLPLPNGQRVIYPF